MAAGLLRQELVKAGLRGIVVHSAGTIADLGSPATPEAIDVMDAHGLDITYHRATPLTRELTRRADLIVVMESAHLEAVRRLDPEAVDKTLLLGESADDPQRSGEINDPYGMPYSYYETTFHRLRKAIARLIEDLRPKAGNNGA
jgi:protein-tyrosine phosphatase